MTNWMTLHPKNPQKRWIKRTAASIREGAVVVYPTDSCYALGCMIGDRQAADRIRRIRRIDGQHLFTLVCRDLSEIATYAKVDNRQYRLLKLATPGPFTFILRATRELPRRIQHEKRKTIGIRVPDHPAAQALLAELDAPLVSCTLQWPGAEFPVNEPQEWRRQLDGVVDSVLDVGSCGLDPTTVIDLTTDMPEIQRHGKGDATTLGL